MNVNRCSTVGLRQGGLCLINPSGSLKERKGLVTIDLRRVTQRRSRLMSFGDVYSFHIIYFVQLLRRRLKSLLRNLEKEIQIRADDCVAELRKLPQEYRQ